MSQLIRINDPKRLSLAEVYALSGKEAGFSFKFKGEIFMDFIDERTGVLKKHKHIKNTRTWWFRNLLIRNNQKITAYGKVFIANDDGDWHIRKNVVRCTYADNGGNYFVDDNPIRTSSPSTYVFQLVAQFNAAPVGTVKTINAVGITGAAARIQGNGLYSHHVIAATRLPGAGETQDEYTILNITYKLTATV